MNSPAAFSQSMRESFWLAAFFGVATLLLYGETTLSMVSIWSRSDTFAHGFLILPISLWLIWNRRDYLSVVSSRPSYLVALLLLPVGFGWLLAWLVDVLIELIPANFRRLLWIAGSMHRPSRYPRKVVLVTQVLISLNCSR